MSQNYTYTAADFERYHSGKMTEAEMHALEKAALEDAFLADALEGYAYTISQAKDIADIKERLLAKQKKIFFIKKDNTWLRIAALFVLIAGIGYLAWQLNFNNENNSLAKKEDSSLLKNTAENPIIPKADSMSLNKDLADAAPLTKDKGFLKKGNGLPEQEGKISSEDLGERTSPAPVQESLQKSSMPDAKKDLSFNRDVNILKGKIVDSTGNPVRYATIKDKDQKIITTSDSTGRFKLASNDTSLTATIAVPGYMTKQKTLSDKKEEVIVMQHDSRNLNEVAITPAPVTREEKKLSDQAAPKNKAAVTTRENIAEPVGGWKQFNEYIQHNISIPSDEAGKSYKGKVVLSFEIKRNGKPVKIKVDQSLCTSCDEEAKRLLNQGPKWKYIKDKRQVVTIDF